MKNDLLQKTPYGYKYQTKSFMVFFGNKKSSLGHWKKSFPQFQPVMAKQVHGHRIVSSQKALSENPCEADGLWTTEIGLSLGVTTADCVPIFVWEIKSNMLMALHAGWKGVAQNILSKGIELFLQKKALPENIRIAIGPHIKSDNFEVEKDILECLLYSVPRKNHSSVYIKKSSNKFLVDLNKIILQQLHPFCISDQQVLTLPINTYTDPDFHSYRRDGESSGRQLSFITQL